MALTCLDGSILPIGRALETPEQATKGHCFTIGGYLYQRTGNHECFRWVPMISHPDNLCCARHGNYTHIPFEPRLLDGTDLS